MKNYVFVSAAVAGLLFAAPAQAGDAAAGENVFKKCKACHYVDREKNKSGPYLVNIVGRAAGAVKGFKYSKVMARSGLVWDEATLTGFLAKPKKYLKGTKMSFAGLKKESDIANVIAYLKSEK
jgi:cytochrome c